MNQPKSKSTAFTLIEVLVVISIIGILCALLLPAIGGAIRQAKKSQAKEEEKSIEIAIRHYLTEYGKLPSSATGGDTTPNNYDIIYTLISTNAGANASYAMNPKRIPFLELPTRKNARDGSGNLCDPWGTPYVIVLDTSYDNSVTDPYGVTYSGICVIVSAGPDKSLTTAGDNVVSLK